MDDVQAALRSVSAVLANAREGTADEQSLLDALATLRVLREHLAAWEPELITAARANATSWTALAPALGVASRQAAERRYLRLQPSSTGETTGEARVNAQRDRRAGDRAVADWARANSSLLRQLAGQISALPDLGPAANRLGAALGDDDPTALVKPLVDTRRHLTAQEHSHLADRLGDIATHTARLRRDAAAQRRDRSGP
ncbi:HSP18 transcriptional regulator [Actinokineospora soli]|uniref:HSP18 transcriptional regulator n=1 Tax=Actinokineospora soli TaxID=1048753 RepID=A0ABW2TPG7_9PSEU